MVQAQRSLNPMSAPIRLMVFQGYRPGYGFYNSFGAETRPLLKFGARGEAVKEAQRGLMNVLQRSFRYGADGSFGPETLAAVKEAQTMFGLRVSGDVDADTWTLILGREIQISGQMPSAGRREPDATTMPVTPPGTSGPGGTGPGRDDGDIAVGGSAGKDKTMLVAGVAVAAVVAVLLMRK